MLNIKLLIYLNLIGLLKACSKYDPLDFKNGRRILCEYVKENGILKEYSEFICDTGYEFKANISKRKVETFNGVKPASLECKPIGCKLYQMPTKEKTDPKNNLIFKSSLCVPAYLENYCLPDLSYVDYECKPGFNLDEQFGFLRVKCLNSYLWDTIPVCNDGYFFDEYEKVSINAKDETKIATILLNSISSKPTTKTPSLTTTSTTTNTAKSSTIKTITSTTIPTTLSSSTITKLATTLISTSATIRTTSKLTSLSTSIKTTELNSNTISPTSTTTRKTTNTTMKIINIFCSKNYPSPKNHNQTLVKYELTNFKESKDLFLPGSKISFPCFLGYFVNKTSNIVTTECDSNGKWTDIGDCEIHACWSKLPKRPLNGIRKTGLFIRGSTGFANGSYVNFTCNQFFERIGKARVFCNNTEWDYDKPICRLRKNICLEKPPLQVNQTVIKSLNRVETFYEYDYTKAEPFTVYTDASYVCLPDSVFADDTKTKYRNFNGTMMAYQNVKCIGINKWEEIPICI